MNAEPADTVRALADAGRVLAAAGLVTAFGHVSARLPADRLLMTPPVPLGTLTPGAPYAEIPLDAPGLPANAPREAWIHVEIARARPRRARDLPGAAAHRHRAGLGRGADPAAATVRARSSAPRCPCSTTPCWYATAPAAGRWPSTWPMPPPSSCGATAR
ncbi:hypothetical protein GCM10020220_102480 [Nonomuraea rubra]